MTRCALAIAWVSFVEAVNGASHHHLIVFFSNDECAKNIGWTWAVTAVGYTLYAAYIVVVSLQQRSGLISCVLFYGRMSLFASFTQSNR